MLKYTISTALFMLVATTVSAAEKCFDDKYIPETTKCSSVGKGNFVDFSAGGCSVIPARVEQVEVECPGKWVNVKKDDNDPSASDTCSSKGLKPTTIDGYSCASGAQRPVTGGDWDLINYRYGTSGNGKGGTMRVNHEIRSGFPVGCSPNSSGSCQPPLVKFSFCYAPGQTQDWGGTDRVVAYACE